MTPDHRSAADTYAREVVREMLALRGWPPSAPKEVRDDVFQTLDRHATLYTRCYTRDINPAVTAKLVQDREWDR